MAELKQVPVPDCCSAEAQTSCCEPGDKASCCGESAVGGGCGCSVGAAAPSMSTDSPIACALDPTGLHERLAALRSIGTAALLSRRGRELRFRADQGIRDRLEAAILAEGKCCPFLELSLTRDGEALVLRIDSAPEALPIADEFAASFDRS
jgi:hypothetical protein